MASPARTTADRFLLPNTVTPVHYALELTPDLEKFVFDGTVDIDVTVNNEDVFSIEMHCHEITINSVTFSGADGFVSNFTGLSYNLDLTTVTFTFPSALPKGCGKVHIEYAGILNDQMAGFYRSKYSDADGKDQYMVSTNQIRKKQSTIISN